MSKKNLIRKKNEYNMEIANYELESLMLTFKVYHREERGFITFAVLNHSFVLYSEVNPHEKVCLTLTTVQPHTSSWVKLH